MERGTTVRGGLTASVLRLFLGEPRWNIGDRRLLIIALMKRAMPRRGRCRHLALLLGLWLAAPGMATQPLIVVNQPWVKPAAAGRTTEAYMNITATDGAVLVAARSDSAAATALQQPGTAKRASTGIALPAGRIVELAPGGYRLWLRGLHKTIRLGDVVPLSLTIRDADGAVQDIAVGAVTRLHSPVEDEHRAHQHRH